MANYQEERVLASAARTAGGNQAFPGDGYGTARTLRAQLDVTAVLGTTPTMTVLVEDSLDGTNWNTIGTFAARTAVGREVINITTPFANRLRVSWTMDGTTPSFTFSVIVASDPE